MNDVYLKLETARQMRRRGFEIEDFNSVVIDPVAGVPYRTNGVVHDGRLFCIDETGGYDLIEPRYLDYPEGAIQSKTRVYGIEDMDNQTLVDSLIRYKELGHLNMVQAARDEILRRLEN